MTLSQENTKDGALYPKIEIDDVVFQLSKSGFNIQTEGELPVYKERAFEQGVKDWMISRMKETETNFK